MKSQLDLMIKGHGPVAQSLALALGALHYKVGLSAPLSPKSGLNAGHTALSTAIDPRHYALSPKSKIFLEGLNAWPDQVFCTPILAMHVHSDKGQVIHLTDKNANPLAHVVSALGLNEQLAKAVHNEPWIDLQGKEPQTQVTPLTLICEGRLSESRSSLGVNFEHTPYLQHALSGNLNANRPHQQIAHQWFLNNENGNEILALLPNGGPQSCSYSFVWSQPAHLAQERMQLAAADLESALTQATQSQLGPLRCLDEPKIWPLIKAKAHQWVGQTDYGSSWCLLGDAAHSVHPLAGMGLNLGLEDAMEMARLLKERQLKGSNRSLSDLHLLRQFERARKAQLLPTWFAMDAIQRLFSHTNPMVESLRNWGAWGFERSPMLKDFVVQKASGIAA
jgi:2-polyprenyl-6-methoxyphenol hydroxylase-like FAD-dependent oxidoreductase